MYILDSLLDHDTPTSKDLARAVVYGHHWAIKPFSHFSHGSAEYRRSSPAISCRDYFKYAFWFMDPTFKGLTYPTYNPYTEFLKPWCLSWQLLSRLKEMLGGTRLRNVEIKRGCKFVLFSFSSQLWIPRPHFPWESQILSSLWDPLHFLLQPGQELTSSSSPPTPTACSGAWLIVLCCAELFSLSTSWILMTSAYQVFLVYGISGKNTLHGLPCLLQGLSMAAGGFIAWTRQSPILYFEA